MIILDLSHPICLFLFVYAIHTPLFRFYVLYLYCSTPVRWLVLIVVSFHYFCFGAKNHLGAFFPPVAPNQDFFFFAFAHTKSSFFKRLNDNPGSFSPHRTSVIHLFFLAMCQGRGQRSSSSRVLLALAPRCKTLFF